MSVAVSPPSVTYPQAEPVGKTRATMTEAEYYALPEPRVEYVRGEAVYMSPVSLPHARLNVFLVSYFNRVARSVGDAEVFADTFAVRLSPQLSRVPDLSVVLKRSRATIRETYIDGAPDLIVEIVSAESRSRDYREKFIDYETAGVTEYVIVDPVYQTIDLYRLDAGKYVRVEEKEGAVASAVLPGLVLRADWLKRSPLPDPATLP